MNQLLTVALRQKAILIPDAAMQSKNRLLTETTGVLIANLSKLGYGVSEQLLQALNNTTYLVCWMCNVPGSFGLK